jgi:hypothetical protein
MEASNGPAPRHEKWCRSYSRCDVGGGASSPREPELQLGAGLLGAHDQAEDATVPARLKRTNLSKWGKHWGWAIYSGCITSTACLRASSCTIHVGQLVNSDTSNKPGCANRLLGKVEVLFSPRGV